MESPRLRQPPPTPDETPSSRGDIPWASLAILASIAIPLFFYKLGAWPWDHDEVAGLLEVDALDLQVPGAPVAQLRRMRLLVPVWWATQKVVLSVLPADEFGSRVLSAASGVLIVLSAFVLGRRWQGRAFGIALAMVLVVNQPLVWLSQHNRFYSEALLFLTWSLGALWWPTGRARLAGVLCIVLSLMSVLCHNLLVVVYGISFLSALIGAAAGAVPRWALARSALMAAATGGVYVLYLRPLLAHWVSGDSGGTSPLVSFAAMIGVPTLALAIIGGAAVLSRGVRSNPLLWWCIGLAGGLAFVGLSPRFLTNWNPRYAVLLMAPAWVLAAFGIAALSESLRRRSLRVALFVGVLVLLLPKLASHWQDGSRHDLRSAAEVAAPRLRAGEVVFCNWPLELAYYLRGRGPGRVIGWEGGNLPGGPCVVVIASNALEPVLHLAGRRCDVIAEFQRRRFDEQSHCVRVYRVGGTAPDVAGTPAATGRPRRDPARGERSAGTCRATSTAGPESGTDAGPGRPLTEPSG